MSPSGAGAGALSAHRTRCGGKKKKMNAPPQSGEHCVTMETALTSEQALCDYSWSLLRSGPIKQGPLLTHREMARAHVTHMFAYTRALTHIHETHSCVHTHTTYQLILTAPP